MDIAARSQAGAGALRARVPGEEIDWEVLPELTEADLEKLGLPLGPRKELPQLPRPTWVNSLAYPGVLLSDRLANTVHHEPSPLVGHTACGAPGACSCLSRKAHE
jgi:hypothetical protein